MNISGNLKLKYPASLYKPNDVNSIVDWFEPNVVLPLFSKKQGGSVEGYSSDRNRVTRLSDGRFYNEFEIDGDKFPLPEITSSLLVDFGAFPVIFADQQLETLSNNLEWYTNRGDIVAILDEADLVDSKFDFYSEVSNELTRRIIYVLWKNGLLVKDNNENACNSLLKGFKDFKNL